MNLTYKKEGEECAYKKIKIYLSNNVDFLKIKIFKKPFLF